MPYILNSYVGRKYKYCIAYKSAELDVGIPKLLLRVDISSWLRKNNFEQFKDWTMANIDVCNVLYVYLKNDEVLLKFMMKFF